MPASALSCTVALAIAALPLAAQTRVSPSEWTDLDAPGMNGFPFGVNVTPFRFLQVHDDLAGAPGTIRGLALRRSGVTWEAVPAFDVTVDLWLSTATTTGTTVDARFDRNHGADKQQVVTNRTIRFPADANGLLPYPFRYAIPFDAPFVFGGAGPLCWEVHVTARTNQPNGLYLDHVGTAWNNPFFVVSRYGLGCLATGRTAPFALTGDSRPDWPNGTVTLDGLCRNGPANAPAVMFLGVDRAAATSIPLPGTASAPSGTCYLQTAPVAQLPGTLDSTGLGSFASRAAANPGLHGLHLFGQVFAVDPAANPWNLVSTDALDYQVLAPYAGGTPGGQVYAMGIPPSGTARPGQLLVVQFRY